MNIPDIATRMSELLAKAEKLALPTGQTHEGFDFVDGSELAEIRTEILSFFTRVFGRDSEYYTEFKQLSSTQLRDNFETAVGVVRAAKNEIDGGWIFTTIGLVSSTIFSDYLQMAYHLVDEGYKDAAAVIAGSTLEEHLRQLCHRDNVSTTTTKHGKAVAKGASRLNDELKGVGTYSALDHQSVLAWIKLRNDAAHGLYQNYTEEQVRLMVQSVRDFIGRIPV